jgi:hypothetical protein
VARRKKKKSKKSDEFKIPDFDERDYMRKEMVHALMMVGAVVLAVLMAIVGGVLTIALTDARIPFVLGIFGILLLKFLYDIMKLDTKEVEKAKWAGAIVTYFMTFIAIWILLINPPVVDMIGPDIENTTPIVQEIGSEVYISVDIEDNEGVDEVVLFYRDPGQESHDNIRMKSIGRNKFKYVIQEPELGTYEFEIEVEDDAGHSDHGSFQFKVVDSEPPEIELFGLSDGFVVTTGRIIEVNIKDNAGVVLAWYCFDDPDCQTKAYKNSKSRAEQRLFMDNPMDSNVDIPTKKLERGNHTLTVCAMDSVPHTTVCQTWNFRIR